MRDIKIEWKKTFLLHFGGEDLQEILKTFEFKDVVTVVRLNCQQMMAIFNKHFKLQQNGSVEKNALQQMSPVRTESNITCHYQQTKYGNF